MANEGLEVYILQIAEGNMAALRQLYDKMSDSLFEYAFSIVRNRQAAEDIMQETFIKIYQHAKSYQRGTKPSAWIYKITRNNCMDYLKRANREILLETVSNLNVPVTDDFIEKSTDREAVAQALNQLEDVERTIVTLYLVVGMKQPEIAKVVDLPYRIVRSKYRYAIKKLQRYFSDKG